MCHPTHCRAEGCQGPPGHPQTSPWGTQGLTAGICATQWEEKLGLYRCLRAGAPQASKVLPIFEQCVPSALGHGGHSQSSGAATSSPEWWVAGSAQGNWVRGPWDCAIQVRVGTPASLLLTRSSPRDGPIAGDRLVFVSTLVHWECQPPSSTRSREPRPGLWWLTAAAVTLVYYTVLISNFSLFKRTLKTLFLTLVLCEACSCVRGGSGTRLSARLLQALGPGRQGVSNRSGS